MLEGKERGPIGQAIIGQPYGWTQLALQSQLDLQKHLIRSEDTSVEQCPSGATLKPQMRGAAREETYCRLAWKPPVRKGHGCKAGKMDS